MDKEVVFTAHATQRLKERSITEDEVLLVLKEGKRVGQSEERKLHEIMNLMVVYEDYPDIVKVITAFRPDKTLEQRIDTLPKPNDWWKQSSRDTFLEEAYMLLEKGFTIDEIMIHFHKLYKAVCAEYGE